MSKHTRFFLTSSLILLALTSPSFPAIQLLGCTFDIAYMAKPAGTGANPTCNVSGSGTAITLTGKKPADPANESVFFFLNTEVSDEFLGFDNVTALVDFSTIQPGSFAGLMVVSSPYVQSGIEDNNHFCRMRLNSHAVLGLLSGTC